MTVVLAALLALYLWDKKALRILFACSLPVAVMLPAFFKLKTTEGMFFYAGLIVICAAPVAEYICKKASPLFEKLIVRTGPAADIEVTEDIVDNKKKWGLIKAGFITSLVLVLILAAAVLTLNSKVNNMYRFTTSQQEMIEEQQQEIEALKEKVKEK